MLLANINSSDLMPTRSVSPSPAYHHFIYEAHGKECDLLRFCLSDQVIKPVSCVVDDSLTPVDYAQLLLTHHAPLLKRKFFADHPSITRYPDPFQTSFMLDQLITVASFYRVITIRPHHIAEVVAMMTSAQIHLLLLDYPLKPMTLYNGLGCFEIAADCFIGDNAQSFTHVDLTTVSDVITLVSHAGDEDWLLAHPVWQQVFLSHPRLVTSFRRFLHSLLTTRMMNDEQISDIYHLTPSDLDHFSLLFITLRQNDRVHPKDIMEYLTLLTNHFTPLPIKHFYAFLMESPFEVFHHIERQVYGHQ